MYSSYCKHERECNNFSDVANLGNKSYNNSGSYSDDNIMFLVWIFFIIIIMGLDIIVLW